MSTARKRRESDSDEDEGDQVYSHTRQISSENALTPTAIEENDTMMEQERKRMFKRSRDPIKIRANKEILQGMFSGVDISTDAAFVGSLMNSRISDKLKRQNLDCAILCGNSKFAQPHRCPLTEISPTSCDFKTSELDILSRHIYGHVVNRHKIIQQIPMVFPSILQLGELITITIPVSMLFHPDIMPADSKAHQKKQEDEMESNLNAMFSITLTDQQKIIEFLETLGLRIDIKVTDLCDYPFLSTFKDFMNSPKNSSSKPFQFKGLENGILYITMNPLVQEVRNASENGCLIPRRFECRVNIWEHFRDQETEEPNKAGECSFVVVTDDEARDLLTFVISNGLNPDSCDLTRFKAVEKDKRELLEVALASMGAAESMEFYYQNVGGEHLHDTKSEQFIRNMLVGSLRSAVPKCIAETVHRLATYPGHHHTRFETPETLRKISSIIHEIEVTFRNQEQQGNSPVRQISRAYNDRLIDIIIPTIHHAMDLAMTNRYREFHDTLDSLDSDVDGFEITAELLSTIKLLDANKNELHVEWQNAVDKFDNMTIVEQNQ